MEQTRDMGGGPALRNGFRGGRLPPKGQIQQIRFRRNMFAADTHEPGFVSIDITTKPGVDNWRGSTSLGFRDAALNARNEFAPVKGDEQHQRYGFNLSGPLWKQRTSLSLSADGVDAFDTQTIVAALPSGYLADSIRRPTRPQCHGALRAHAHQIAVLRAGAAQPRPDRQPRVGDFDPLERGYRQTRTEQVLRASNAGAIGKTMATSSACSGVPRSPTPGEHRAGGAGAERVRRGGAQLAARAGRTRSRSPTTPT